MKTIIKLLIVAAVVNAAARVGLAAYHFYQLEDQSQQFVTFGGNVSPGDLQQRIADQASALRVPLQFDQIEVVRDGLKTTASAAYTEPVEVFPNYKYPIPFKFSVEGLNLGQGASTGANPLRN